MTAAQSDPGAAPAAAPIAQNPPIPRPVTLALQGGGALGAFSWGVLDRLLDEPGLKITVASGTSAGAMNAAMLVQGLACGGPEAAKALLEKFWRRVAVAAGSPDFEGSGWFGPFDSVLGRMADAMRRPAGALDQRRVCTLATNPLRAVLDGLFDPKILGQPGAPSLVVAATRVSTGEPRLFRDAEVTQDVLLASACLPQLMPPVEIDGALYWDGGFASNPPLRPLIEAGAPSDMILVRTTPMERPDPPQGASATRDRAAELAFSAALRQELRSIAVARRLLAELPAPPPADSALARLCRARLHAIGAEEIFRTLPAGSARDASWGFLHRLHDLGFDAAARWLAENASAIGTSATFDLAPFAAPLVAFDDPDDGDDAAESAPPDPVPPRWWRRALRGGSGARD